MTNHSKSFSKRYLTAGLLPVVLAVLFGTGCVGSRAYRDGEEAEGRKHWDLAVMAFEKAVQEEPDNSRYNMALRRTKQSAALAHFEKGKLYRASGQLDMALIELEQSVALDPSIDASRYELALVKEAHAARKLEGEKGTSIEKAKAKARGSRATPPMLNPSSDKPIDLVFPTDTNIKRIYGVLASAAGINVIYDPQLKDDKYAIDLRGVTFQKGLEVLMRQAGHFYKVIDEKTILVAQDNNQNRREYEDLVIRTFFLSNGDVKDVSNMIRSILDLRRLGVIPQLNAIVIRDTADKVAVAEKIIEVNDKAKAEVIIEVELVQLNTTKTIELGTKLSAYSVTAGVVSSDGKAVTSLPWGDISKLSISDLSFSIPTVTFNFVKDNSDAEVLAKPSLRIAEGEKAQLVIGDRVPIPVTTVNTQTAVGSTGIVPITSFQYQDVGIKIDMEPRVHHNKEVTLKLTVEVSQLNGEIQGPNGQNQPIIGTRTITSTIRLKDGETNILAGLIRTDITKSKKTIPFLGDLPIIGALFTNMKDDHKRTDLMLTLTPRIVRAPQITEDDLIPIWVGTENNVSFSGSSTRLESPSAPGSPFDPPDASLKAIAPGGPATPPSRTIGRQPSTSMPQVVPGGAPNDPFKKPTIPVVPAPGSVGTPDSPAPQMQKNTQGEPEALPQDADAASEPAAPVKIQPRLGFVADQAEIGVDGTSTITLEGLSGLADLNALEMTVEWDPAVVQVTGISQGEWADSPIAPSLRFDAERVEGRALLQISRKGDAIGLPEGALARIDIKGRAAGVSLFRVSAAAGLGRQGGVRPEAEAILFRVAGTN
jgi:general secretion pathway protein D